MHIKILIIFINMEETYIEILSKVWDPESC